MSDLLLLNGLIWLLVISLSSFSSSQDARPCRLICVAGDGCTDDVVMGSLWLSNGSGSLLERMVIGGGGGPANIVGLFRNCC